MAWFWLHIEVIRLQRASQLKRHQQNHVTAEGLHKGHIQKMSFTWSIRAFRVCLQLAEANGYCCEKAPSLAVRCGQNKVLQSHFKGKRAMKGRPMMVVLRVYKLKEMLDREFSSFGGKAGCWNYGYERSWADSSTLYPAKWQLLDLYIRTRKVLVKRSGL